MKTAYKIIMLTIAISTGSSLLGYSVVFWLEGGYGLAPAAVAFGASGWLLVSIFVGLFIPTIDTPIDKALQAKARAEEDMMTVGQFRATKWNNTVPVGTSCLYLKSEIEGKVIAKSSRAAWVLGEDVFVELEHIGMVLLDKVEVFWIEN